jgi:hypothetical protein
MTRKRNSPMKKIHRIRSRERGPSPLSARTRRKILAALRDRALAGDVAAGEALVRLGHEKRPKSAEGRKAA